jgi:hypothetical protein
VRIFGETYERRAEVATIGGLSAHFAGQTFLLEYAVPTLSAGYKIPPKAATSLVTDSALTAGLNNPGGRTVKVQGICDRDRSVRAGRSHFLIALPSFYILLGDCQGVVGHWEQDFDTGTHLSGICLYVTYVPFCPTTLYPVALFAIQTQTVQD